MYTQRLSLSRFYVHKDTLLNRECQYKTRIFTIFTQNSVRIITIKCSQKFKILLQIRL